MREYINKKTNQAFAICDYFFKNNQKYYIVVYESGYHRTISAEKLEQITK